MRVVISAFALLTFVYACSLAQGPPSLSATQELKNKLGIFIAQNQPPASPAHGGKTRLTGKASPEKHVRHQGNRVILSAHPAVLVNGSPVGFSIPTELKNGRTLVGIRDFADYLSNQCGVPITVDWVNGEVKVHVDPMHESSKPSPALAAGMGDRIFGDGLVALWHGQVAEALKRFQEAGPKGSVDAKEMVDWLVSTGADKGRYGIVRFQWRQMPEKARVFLDESEVDASVLFIVAPTGSHQLHIEADGATLYEHDITVVADKAYIVRLAP